MIRSHCPYCGQVCGAADSLTSDGRSDIFGITAALLSEDRQLVSDAETGLSAATFSVMFKRVTPRPVSPPVADTRTAVVSASECHPGRAVIVDATYPIGIHCTVCGCPSR